MNDFMYYGTIKGMISVIGGHGGHMVRSTLASTSKTTMTLTRKYHTRIFQIEWIFKTQTTTSCATLRSNFLVVLHP
jgi:hypothetical protein